MFAPALGTEGRSEILECHSLLQCVSSRVLDCYCLWYFGAYHSFCLVDVYFKSLALQCSLPVSKTVLHPRLSLLRQCQVICIQHVPWNLPADMLCMIQHPLLL